MMPERSEDIKEEIKDGILIVRIRGRLDSLSSPNVEKKICESIDNGQSKILLDMSGVTYLSSTGLRMLFSTTKKVRAFSGRVALCSTTPNVLEVLKISGFDHTLDLYSTEDDALKHL